MRRFAIIVMLSLGAALPAHAQATALSEQALPDRSYRLLREDEDWSFLREPGLRRDFWDAIKYIPLRGSKENWFISIGGEVREVWEQVGNDNWGQQPYTNGYLNERYMLYFDVHYGKHVRTFVELKSGLNTFRIGGPRPIDEKKLDFQVAFAELGTSWGQNSMKLRVGRQELEYGSGRLIDVREGPNVRMSFDGFLVRTKIGSWETDGFAVRPNLDNSGFFDNAPNHAVGFWGVYATRNLQHNTFLDMYYLGLNQKRSSFERGTAQELRHSVGVRISRPSATESPHWDFDYEATWQFGTFGSGNIRAWTFSSETGYKYPTLPLKPRFSIKADIASGDDPRAKELGTFNALFPSGNYFGVLAAATGPGPVNYIDVHPRLETAFPRNVSLSVDWIFQWRESLEDGVYDMAGSLIRPAGGSRARFIGHRPGAELLWQANRHLWFQADYGVFYAGRFLKETRPGRNLSYWALWAGYKF